MVVHKKKRVICTTIMLVLTTFVGMSITVNAQDLIADTGGPYLGQECVSIKLNASNSSGPDGVQLRYRWDLDDGAGWSMYYYSPILEWLWQDDFEGTILLEVSYDGSTEVAVDSTQVIIENIPPQITYINGPTVIDIGTPADFDVNFYDGSPDERQIPSFDEYIASFSWDDGSTDEMPLEAGVFSASASHTYEVAGSYLLNISIMDDNGGIDSVEWVLVVGGTNEPMVEAGPDGAIDEGSFFVSSGYFTKTGNNFFAYVSYGDYEEGELQLNAGNTFDLIHQYGDNGDYTIYVILLENISGEYVEFGSDFATVHVNNLPPVIESMSSSADPVQLGTPITLTAMFSDPGFLDTHIATVEWGDEQTTETELEFGTYAVEENHTYETPGVYQITLTITDDDGGSDTESLSYYIVVYDSNDGFVTGGGWIIAPPGSYPADPNLTGKATFGFVSKYKKGKTYPEGNTEFQFHAAGMNFHSHTYDWLIVAGSRAMYKGSGTINGEGNYTFMLTCLDGKNSGDVDTFRIKIWYEDDNGDDVIVFDNGNDTPLEAGQITIHKA